MSDRWGPTGCLRKTKCHRVTGELNVRLGQEDLALLRASVLPRGGMLVGIAVALSIFSILVAGMIHVAPLSATKLMVLDNSDANSIAAPQDSQNKINSTVLDSADEFTITETLIDQDGAPIRYFDGKPIRPVKTLLMEVTAYSPDARSCAPFDDGITASGYSVWTNGMKLIAADKKYKFGTLMSVPNYNGGRPAPVLDRGGAIRGNRLDVLFATHRQARKWGRQQITVTIWDYVESQ